MNILEIEMVKAESFEDCSVVRDHNYEKCFVVYTTGVELSEWKKFGIPYHINLKTHNRIIASTDKKIAVPHISQEIAKKLIS